MTQQERIKQIEERAGSKFASLNYIDTYIDGATSMLPEIEALEKRVKELEEENKKLQSKVSNLELRLSYY